MGNRQKDAATTHATYSTLKLVSVSAVALMIGIGGAAAQGGSARQTEHTIEKQKDNELLTPIRPLPRKVGETSWPEAKPEAQREANDRKAAAPRETTGQAMSAETNKSAPASSQPTQTPPAQNNQTATGQPQPTQNSQPQPAATAQNDTKPQAPSQNNQAAQQPQQSNPAQAAQPAQNQNTAQNAPAPNNAQQPAQQNNAQQPAQQNNTQQAQNNAQPDHASIRLGTDASGKVVINEDQEQQLARALRRARPAEVNVGVQIGGPAPQGVRLAAVSRDMVDVLPQFRGYSYFVTGEQVYIVDAAANRVVAMVPVKPTVTVKREAPPRSTVGSAHAAQPEPTAAPANTAPANTATATVTSEPRSRRSIRRSDELAGIEAAIEREVQRKGLRSETVVVEEGPVIQRVPTRRWRPWFAGDVQ